MGFLWYCFAQILQNDLHIVREHWNSHRIKKSRHNTVSGPDSLFFLPEHHGATANLLYAVPQSEIDYTAENILQVDGFDEYQDYFDYARSALNMEMPSNWQEADSLYRKHVEVSENGT